MGRQLWRDTDILGPIRSGIEHIPFEFDTDVNAPAMAEVIGSSLYSLS
jgi:hypothetical protein